MHRAKAANKALIAGSLVIFFGCFALIRIHTTIGDTAFLRSMIPHHDPEACAGVHRDSVLLPASGVARHALAGPGSPAASDAMLEKAYGTKVGAAAFRRILLRSAPTRDRLLSVGAPQNAKWFIPPCMKVPPRNPWIEIASVIRPSTAQYNDRDRSGPLRWRAAIQASATPKTAIDVPSQRLSLIHI